jgi:hypothetical protein
MRMTKACTRGKFPAATGRAAGGVASYQSAPGVCGPEHGSAAEQAGAPRLRAGPRVWRFLQGNHGGRCAIGVLMQLALVSAVVMGMSHTISKERIFAPLRDRLGGKETWLGYLVSCPYCVSHYLAFVLVPLTGTYPIPVRVDLGFFSRVLEWFLASILVTVVAAFLRVLFWSVDELQSLVRRERGKVEEETELLREQLEDERRAPH